MAELSRDFADAHRLSHLLWEVSARASALTESALTDLPLTAASSGVLDAVATTPGASIADLARWLPTSAQGISQIVGRLERLGYLERRLGARGYGVALHVTPSGETARRDANHRIQDVDAELTQALGPQPETSSSSYSTTPARRSRASPRNHQPGPAPPARTTARRKRNGNPGGEVRIQHPRRRLPRVPKARDAHPR